MNFFKYFNKYYQVNKVDYDINSLKVRLKNKLNIGHRAFGTNQYVIDIEVNDKNPGPRRRSGQHSDDGKNAPLSHNPSLVSAVG